MKNFHIPLSDKLDDELRATAKRMKVPATVLARRAIEEWLKQRHRAELHNAISQYASRCAGSEADYIPSLEEASIELLLNEEEEKKYK